MTIGVFLLSRMEVHTSAALEALYMVLLGMGLGGVMQVLVIIVQNAVPHSDLGVATSAATFFRSIGGSFGTAIFGAIFSNVVVSDVKKHLHGTPIPHGFNLANVTPKVLGQLPSGGPRGYRLRLRRSDRHCFCHSGADRGSCLRLHLVDP